MFNPNQGVVKLLLEAGCDPNAKSRNGYTPLHNAVAANNLGAAYLLLQYGADANVKNRDGVSPLEKARKEGKRAMATLLFR
jgi:ankyrin repeat protein